MACCPLAALPPAPSGGCRKRSIIVLEIELRNDFMMRFLIVARRRAQVESVRDNQGFPDVAVDAGLGANEADAECCINVFV
jgi:hypothetical protein